jgi:hypothetical protein
MARKGLRGTTVRYMDTELEPQIVTLQQQIPIMQQEERKLHHIMALVNTISSRLHIDKTNDPDWLRLAKEYDNLVEQLILAKQLDVDLVNEFNLLVDVLDNKFSREKSRAIIKNSLWTKRSRNTTSPENKGGRNKSRTKRKTSRRPRGRTRRRYPHRTRGGRRTYKV